MKLLALFVAASIATGVVVSDAHASLTFTINTLTTNEFSFTLAGTFDADVIGHQTQWLAIKNDWSNNVGQNTDWIAEYIGWEFLEDTSLTVIENSVTFNGSPAASSVVSASGQTWGDSFHFNAGFGILAGTVVAGTLTVTGTNAFNPLSATNLQLLSGYDNANQEWVRLESLDGGCLAVTSQEVVCHADGTTFTVNIEGINACTGGMTQVTFTASGGAVGQELCFFTAVGDGSFCCFTEICVTIPDCTPVALPSDLDGDGIVGMVDFLALLGAWGPCSDCGTPQACPADFDGDCAVDIGDLLILLGNWG
jgi:hypothetical protein